MILAAWLLASLGGLAWAALMVRIRLVVARMYQIEEYEGSRLFAWGATRTWQVHRSVIAATAFAVGGTVVAAVLGGDAGRLGLAAGFAGGAGLAGALWSWLPPKKALVHTGRMRRLLRTSGGLAAIVAVLLVVCVAAAPLPVAVGVVLVFSTRVTEVGLVLLPLANLLLRPVEARVRAGFVTQAQRRLALWQPQVIGIAGSWGKTTTKHITAHLLARYGETLATPKSFNTLMGVTRAINENLEERHRTFLVEMDAYGPGEIADICALVHPSSAVITSVGPQHLERFGTVDRIADALYELPAALPADGVCIVHAGEPLCAALADRAQRAGLRVIRYGVEGEQPGPFDVVAGDVTLDAHGAHFTWRWPERGLEHHVDVPLLGRHQVLNVSAALALVTQLGLPLQPALDALRTLLPVEHRLQPIPTGNGVVVIDDSYNANPVGVHNALEVLQDMPAGTRVLVTPGLVELGAVEAAENHRYGVHAAQVCDHVIVVESRSNQALREGLRQGGLAADRTHLVRTLEQATAIISTVTRPGDVVLFANDLPDTYLDA